MSDLDNKNTQKNNEISKDDLIKQEVEASKAHLEDIKSKLNRDHPKDKEPKGKPNKKDKMDKIFAEIEAKEDKDITPEVKDNEPQTPANADEFTKNAIQEMKDAAEEKGITLDTPFKMTEKGRKAVAMATSLAQMKHGIYAQIPIICHGQECPYSNVCRLYQLGKAPKGDQCPIEISIMEELIEKYFTELDIKENDIIDASMVRNLISLDIQLMRANKKAAVQSDIVESVPIGVTDEGEAIYQPQIAKAYEVQDILLRRREKILKMLNATRADKAKDKTLDGIDPSSLISEMKKRLTKYKEQEDNTIDISNGVTEDDKDNKGKEKKKE